MQAMFDDIDLDDNETLEIVERVTKKRPQRSKEEQVSIRRKVEEVLSRRAAEDFLGDPYTL